MSVIGFDIGNESCVIAAAKRGGVDVLLNDEAKRETPSVVSFGDKQRFLGSAGAAFATANPKSTISQIKRLIGKLYKEVEEELKLLPFATREGPRGGILIEFQYLKREWAFTPVEILAMLFKHLKHITEKNLESAVVDCVIGIPSYFTDLQRRLYLDAALIAGLKPLRLMHDGTAIALGYGMYKTDFSNSGPTYVMFVDIGHCDTQVTVAAFEQERMKILSHSFDQNLGGRDFDEVLFKYFAAQFNEKHKIDVCSNARASIRLRASCEKVKKVLSANAEAPLSIECLIGDTDVRGLITREEFENLSSNLLERVIVPCKMALEDSGLSVDKLYTIELVGSGSRIPAITRVLTSFLEKEPTRTLNASECVARGCALRCAMLSPNTQVRDYKINDSFPYTIVLPSPQGEYMLFSKGSLFPNETTMKHYGNTPFYFQVLYINGKNFPAGISHIVGSFGIGPWEPSDAEKMEVEFRLKLNSHGIVDLVSATILENKRRSAWSVNSNPWKMMMADSHILNLPVSENSDVSTTNDELVEAIEKEKLLTEQDIKVEEIKDQRNTLESFVYDSRSKLSGAYRSFAKDSEKEVIMKNLQETEDWLYEDSDDESEQDYTGKLEDLKKLIEPIENKYNEENARAKATKALQACIAECHLLADSLSDDKKEKVKNLCSQTEVWLNRHSPKALSTDINHKIEVVKRNCKSIIKSKSSILRNEEHIDSEQREQTSEPEQRDHPVDSENARKKATKALETCIAKYRLQAESLPADNKKKVKIVCTKAEHWLINAVSQKHSSPMLTEINNAIDYVERNCKSIIRSKPSIPRHEEPVASDQRDQTLELDQKDQPMDSENSRKKAAKALQTCIAKCRSHAESIPADLKEKVENRCTEAEQWLINAVFPTHSSLKISLTDINNAIANVESYCESIIKSNCSSSMHEEPVASDQRDQTLELDQKDQPMDSETSRKKAAKALQTCIAKYRSHAESLPADMKEKVENGCTVAELWLIDAVFPKHLSPKISLTDINNAIANVESYCESIIKSKSLSTMHEEPDSDKRDQPMGGNQIDQPFDSDQMIEAMDMDQIHQSEDSGQRDPHNDSQVHN